MCSWFFQWYQWYTDVVQGSTNGTIGNTIGTNGNANGTIGSPNGTIGKPMVPLATIVTIGKISNGTIGITPNRPIVFLMQLGRNNYMEGSGSATIKPEDQWSCKRSPDILA